MRPGPLGPRATIPREGVKGFSPATCLENRHKICERLEGGARGPVVEPVPVRPVDPSLVGDAVVFVDAHTALRSLARFRGRRWRGPRPAAGPRSAVPRARFR